MSELHISICRHWKHLLLGLHLKKLLQNRHKLSHRHRGSIPQIKNPKLRRPFLLPPTPSTLLRGIQSPQTPLHNVVNVGEIPRHGSPIGRFEYRNLLPLENVLREEEVRHVGPAPGPVNSEEAKPGNGEPVDVVIAVSDFFPCFLCGGVEARGLIRTVLFGEGDFGIEAVDGAGRGPDDGGLRVSAFGSF
ncbi:hypothetical protein JHK86_011855 [Glycine max]|nr:hypothetical protein JHK86_011855 [Glycine max]